MILVTGATGFIGKSLVEKLLNDHHPVRVLVRSGRHHNFINCDLKVIVDSNIPQEMLFGVKAVIHLAARAHVMSEKKEDTNNPYWEPNVELTRTLAVKAAAAGVERFIFLSSAKVFGEGLEDNEPYSEQSIPSPVGWYAESKLSAEIALREVSMLSKMEFVIIRPPLVYGPGVRANFLSLMKVVSSSIPLPFRGLSNKRSMIFIENLNDFICHCLGHKNAANQVFTISDGRDLTILELCDSMVSVMGKRSMRFKLPLFLLHFLSRFRLTQKFYDRVFGSFVIDPSKASSLLGWTPPVTVENGIKNTVQYFMSGKRD
jgi:nucleoside-diphosphate-sugar epimerase